MRSRQSAAGLSLLACLALAAPAQADTQISASVRDIGVTLKDLNAADGVTPALTWTGLPTLSASSRDDVQSGWTSDNYGGSITYLSPQWTDTGSRYIAGSASFAAASALGWGQQTLTTSPSGPVAMSITHEIGAGNTTRANVGWYQFFELSPHSEVSFSFVVDGAFSSDGPAGTFPGLGGSRNSASLNFYASAGGISRSLAMSAGTSWPDAQASFSQSFEGESLRLTLRNESDLPTSYTLNLNLNTFAFETLAPVPEPSTYALMALGLAGVGLAARRRKAV